MAIENAKLFNVRIKNKYDSVENWNASNLILEKGEIAIAHTTVDVNVGEGTAKHPALLMKVGDGEKTFANLPWLSAKAADVLSVCKSTTELTAFVNNVIAKAGIASDSAMKELSNKVTTIEGKVTTAEQAIDALELLVGSTSVQAQIKAAIAALNLDTTYEKVGVAKDLVDAEAAIARVAEKANADAIAAINNEETGILAQAKDYTDEEMVFENGITTVNALGGIAANTSLDGKTVTEILDMLLFPYVKQTVTNVKGTPNGGTYEHGNNQIITSVSGTVTKKSKPITKVELLQGSTVLATKEGDAVKNGGTITFSGLNVAVNSTNVQLTMRATDENGSTAEAKTSAFIFVYPYYHGVCAAGAAIDEALVEGLTKDVSGKGQKTYSYTTDNSCAVIAYPKAHGALKSALDPNAFENIAAFTQHTVSVTGLDGKAQDYYVYVSGAFTGSGFKYTFKY